MAGAITERYIVANILTPAGTTAAAPQSTAIDLGDVMLLTARLHIPSGHCGLTGWRIDFSGVTILPYSNPSAWLIGDNDRELFQVDYEVGNTLKIVTYNTDIYDHTHYCTFKVTELPAQVSVGFTPLSIVANG